MWVCVYFCSCCWLAWKINVLNDLPWKRKHQGGGEPSDRRGLWWIVPLKQGRPRSGVKGAAGVESVSILTQAHVHAWWCHYMFKDMCPKIIFKSMASRLSAQSIPVIYIPKREKEEETYFIRKKIALLKSCLFSPKKVGDTYSGGCHNNPSGSWSLSSSAHLPFPLQLRPESWQLIKATPALITLFHSNTSS